MNAKLTLLLIGDLTPEHWEFVESLKDQIAVVTIEPYHENLAVIIGSDDDCSTLKRLLQAQVAAHGFLVFEGPLPQYFRGDQHDEVFRCAVLGA